MPALLELEYFLLLYAPNPSARDDECVNVGLVVFDSRSVSQGFCGARFAPSWQLRVKGVDPDADIDVLAATFRDIARQLEDPSLRAEMLTMIQESFSNSIRISQKQKCITKDPEAEIEAMATRFFR